MRISDWSSDVCSSDLNRARRGVELVRRVGQLEPHELGRAHEPLGVLVQLEGLSVVNPRPLEYTARVMQAVRQDVNLGLAPRHHPAVLPDQAITIRSEEHTSELQSLMRISYAVFCLKKNTQNQTT